MKFLCYASLRERICFRIKWARNVSKVIRVIIAIKKNIATFLSIPENEKIQSSNNLRSLSTFNRSNLWKLKKN